MKSRILLSVIVFFTVVTSPLLCMKNIKNMSIETLMGHRSAVESVSFDRTGLLRSTSVDHETKIWEKKMDTWQCVKTFSLDWLSNNNCSYLFFDTGETFDSNAECGATWFHDNVIKIHKRIGEKWFFVGMLVGHADTITSVVFSPDDKTIVSSSRDKTIKIWKNPLYNSTSLFTGNQLDSVQQKTIKKMYKPTASKKNPLNDMKIFFKEALLDIEELNEDVDKKKTGKY